MEPSYAPQIIRNSPVKAPFPERLRVRIEAEAEKSERSMNAKIVHRLEQSSRAMTAPTW